MIQAWINLGLHCIMLLSVYGRYQTKWYGMSASRGPSRNHIQGTANG